MSKTSFKRLFADARQRDSYWIAKAIEDFTEDLFRLMEQQGVSKAELARRIDSSPAYVTKVLRGNTNFTIESMVRLVRALDGKVCVHAAPDHQHTHWIDSVRPGAANSVVAGWQNWVPVGQQAIANPTNQREISDESAIAA